MSLTVMGALSARASTINYGNFGIPGGVMFQNVTESSVTDPGALFNVPTLQGNQLRFNNPTFVSSSSNGSADTTASTVSVRIRAADNEFLEKVIFTEIGEFEFDGSGTNATATTASGALTVIILTPGAQGVHNVPLKLTPVPIYPIALGDGTFAGIAEMDLTGLGVTDVLVSFSNYLQSSSEQGTTATIRKNRVTIDTPEPATAILALAGMVPLMMRRRHRR